ncbi:MAG: type II secretion protein F, partial [Microbacterium sp.]
MTLLWGGVLAVGLLLVASPWLWPKGRRPVAARPAASGLAALLAAAGLAHRPPSTVVVAGAG